MLMTTTTTIKAGFLSNEDSDDSNDDVPNEVTHKTLLAKHMEKRLFVLKEQEYKGDDNSSSLAIGNMEETFPYHKDNAGKASPHNHDDSDSDMSFVVVHSQHSKPSATTILENTKRNSKRSTIHSLDEQSSDKENVGTFSPKKKMTFLKPPPKNTNQPLYCRRTLDLYSTTFQNPSNRVAVEEYTCDCCRPNNDLPTTQVKQSAISRYDHELSSNATPRAVVIESDDDDEDEVLSAIVHVDSPGVSSSDQNSSNNNNSNTLDGSFLQLDTPRSPEGSFGSSSSGSETESESETEGLLERLKTNRSAIQQLRQLKSQQEEHVPNYPSSSRLRAPQFVDLMDTSSSSESESNKQFRKSSVSKGFGRKPVASNDDNPSKTAKPLRFRKVNATTRIPASARSITTSFPPPKGISNKDDTQKVEKDTTHKEIEDHRDNDNLVELFRRVNIQDGSNSNPKTMQNKPRRHARKLDDINFSNDSILVPDEDESSYIEISDDDDDDTTDSASEGSFVVKPKRNDTAAASNRKPVEIQPFPKPSSTVSKPKTAPHHLSGRAFQQQREALANETFSSFNKAAFDGKLASVELAWSKNLKTTAGITRLVTISRGKTELRKEAKIELAIKIIVDMERLRATLLHEMCHAAMWLIDGVAKPAHGICFKKWSKIAMKKIPCVTVTTTHTYEISYKYAWACTSCNAVIKRHSRSVDVQSQCCGRCQGRLVEINPPKPRGETYTAGNGQRLTANQDLTPKKKAPLSAYNLFIQEHSKTVREALTRDRRAAGILTKVTQGEVTKECARLWKEQKAFL